MRTWSTSAFDGRRHVDERDEDEEDRNTIGERHDPHESLDHRSPSKIACAHPGDDRQGDEQLEFDRDRVVDTLVSERRKPRLLPAVALIVHEIMVDAFGVKCHTGNGLSVGSELRWRRRATQTFCSPMADGRNCATGHGARIKPGGCSLATPCKQCN